MARKDKSSTNIAVVEELNNEIHTFLAYGRSAILSSDWYIDSSTPDYRCYDPILCCRY
jgi:hypothetical protein